MDGPQSETNRALGASTITPPALNYQVLFATMLGDVYEAIQSASRLQSEVARNEDLIHRLANMAERLSRIQQTLHEGTVRLEVTLDRFDGENERFIRIHKATLDAMRSELAHIARHQRVDRSSQTSLLPWLLAIAFGCVSSFLLGWFLH